MRPGTSNRDPDYRYPDWMMEERTPPVKMPEVKPRGQQRNIDLSEAVGPFPSLNPDNRKVETVRAMTFRKILASVFYLLGAILIAVTVWNVAPDFFLLALGIVTYITGILLGFE